jgi:hypothetical protein
MTDNKTLELQHQIRQNAVKFQEEFKDLKNFEKEMKRKEQEMLNISANMNNNNQVLANYNRWIISLYELISYLINIK